jgi:hypothetical protein
VFGGETENPVTNNLKTEYSASYRFLECYNSKNYSIDEQERITCRKQLISLILSELMTHLSSFAVSTDILISSSISSMSSSSSSVLVKDATATASTSIATSLWQEWICSTCTYFNRKRQLLSMNVTLLCDICAAPRITEKKKSPLAAISASSSSSSQGYLNSQNKTSVEVIEITDSDDEDEEAVIVTVTESPCEAELSSSEKWLQSLSFRTWSIHSIIPTSSPSFSSNVVSTTNSNLQDIVSIQELSSLLLNLNIKEREENNLLQDCFKIFSFSDNTAIPVLHLKAFYVHGQRFGDPSSRKGKSAFCGNISCGVCLLLIFFTFHRS